MDMMVGEGSDAVEGVVVDEDGGEVDEGWRGDVGAAVVGARADEAAPAVAENGRRGMDKTDVAPAERGIAWNTEQEISWEGRGVPGR